MLIKVFIVVLLCLGFLLFDMCLCVKVRRCGCLCGLYGEEWMCIVFGVKIKCSELELESVKDVL